jgi:hypothetical protein
MYTGSTSKSQNNAGTSNSLPSKVPDRTNIPFPAERGFGHFELEWVYQLVEEYLE